jgi:hypothetical protein
VSSKNLYNKNSPKSQSPAMHRPYIFSSLKVPQFDSLDPYFFLVFYILK